MKDELRVNDCYGFNIHITGIVMDVRTPIIIYSFLMIIYPHLRSGFKSIISILDFRTNSRVLGFKNFVMSYHTNLNFLHDDSR
jgi:hypothetical protein